MIFRSPRERLTFVSRSFFDRGAGTGGRFPRYAPAEVFPEAGSFCTERW